jgi:hypothetical protein
MTVNRTPQVPASSVPFPSSVLFEDWVAFTGSKKAGPFENRISKEKETTQGIVCSSIPNILPQALSYAAVPSFRISPSMGYRPQAT